MKNLWKFLATGILIAAAGQGVKATPTGTGTYTDTRLTPTTSPPAAVGNDMLLAENVSGPYFSTCPAASWTTDLHMGPGDTYHGITSGGEQDLDAMWTGTGPTGTYAAGTAGVGKHTENTKADIKKWWASGPIVYQDVSHVKSYDTTTGGSVINTDMTTGYMSYQIP